MRVAVYVYWGGCWSQGEVRKFSVRERAHNSIYFSPFV